jgi:hypothetical protein
MDYSQNSGLPSLMGSYGNIPQGMNQGQQMGGGNPYFPSMPSYQPQQQYQQPYQQPYQQNNWGGFMPSQFNDQNGAGNVYGPNNYGYGIMPPQQQYMPTAQPLNMSSYSQSKIDAQNAAENARKAEEAARAAQIEYHANNHR